MAPQVPPPPPIGSHVRTATELANCGYFNKIIFWPRRHKQKEIMERNRLRYLPHPNKTFDLSAFLSQLGRCRD